jgi:murein DD-endopeptidase MepM/ murein hydrolase activator NlpD
MIILVYSLSKHHYIYTESGDFVLSNHFPRSLILGTIATITASASYALITPVANLGSSISTSWRSTQSLAIPQLSTTDESNDDYSDEKDIKLVYEIQPGDTISGILSKYGANKAAFQGVLTSADWVERLSLIRPGEIINLRFSQDNVLEELVYTPSKIETIKFYRTDSGYEGQKLVRKPERRIMLTHGTIDSSLFLDGKKAGLSEKLIVQLAKIFAWDIDFALNIQPDDQFTLIYEKLYLDGEEYDTGGIQAAEFVTSGQTFRAIRYVDSQGLVNYYDPEGNNLRKSFLRTPVEFTRISSRFNLHRRHPVLNRIRAHKGVDYAAPKGTPVRATGDGKIRFIGTKRGYGHVIIVQHQQKYSTLYAHLLHFDKKVKRTKTVRQGQIIGYVGKSGLASGYHLHYEFRIKGVHRNPLTVQLPIAPAIEKTRLAEFKRNTNALLNQLDKAKVILVARSD